MYNIRKKNIKYTTFLPICSLNQTTHPRLLHDITPKNDGMGQRMGDTKNQHQFPQKNKVAA
ncbi:hypothetical protein Hanom_Chr02g00173581 [Helianthus anomalus]